MFDKYEKVGRLNSVFYALVICVLTCILPGCHSSDSQHTDSQTVTSTRVPTPEEATELRRELLSMAALDQFYRNMDTIQTMAPDEQQAFIAKGHETDIQNTKRLKEIVAQFGFPTIDMVGEEASHAAFLLVQHADDDPEFQAACLPLLEEGARNGTVSKVALAYLTDRVRVKQGRPQVYGTQYETVDADTGGFYYVVPLVEDLPNLDIRRDSVGLGPWIEYEQRMAELQDREPQSSARSAE